MSARLEERARAVRDGEQLDAEALARYLRKRVGGFDGAIEIEQFPGGHSNLTYLVRAGENEWVLRRPPFGATVASAHDMGREYRVLSRLHKVFPKAPTPVIHCDETAVIGAPFYVMNRMPGVIYRAQKPNAFALKPHRVRDACYEFIETLAELHLVDYQLAGLDDLYKGPGYLDRQVRGWAARWAGAKIDDTPKMDRVEKWIGERRPPRDYAATVIHNDFKFDNLVYDTDSGKKLVGVLDWEMSTIGDPLSDFATTLTTWHTGDDEPASTVAPCFLIRETGALTRDELIRIYQRRTGFDVSDLLWYYVFALYKGAIILQQIYYRYHHGHTRDQRFAPLGDVARSLAHRAEEAIDTQTI